MSNDADDTDISIESGSEEDLLRRMQHRHSLSQREREENARGETGK